MNNHSIITDLSINTINSDNFQKHLLVDGNTEIYLYEPWQKLGILHGFIGRGVDFSTQHQSAEAQRMAQLLGLDDLQILKQVHGCRILSGIQLSTELPEADGFFWQLEKNSSKAPKSAYGIKTADCVPILLRSNFSFAILHAGWRGIAANILEECLQQMVDHHQKKIVTDRGLNRPPQEIEATQEIEIVIGPCACVDCYEVGTDVIAALSPNVVFKDLLDKSSTKMCNRSTDAKVLLDMPHTLLKRALLFCEQFKANDADASYVVAGNPPPVVIKQFSSLPLCTMHNKNFHSHRRDRELSGRNISFMA